ncbi:hypothetical protein [Vibrio alginolyticus]
MSKNAIQGKAVPIFTF